MSGARLFAIAAAGCFALVILASAVVRTACEGDFEGCGTTGEAAWIVSTGAAAGVVFFLLLAGLALAVRIVRRSR
jgi:hypothetical protein